MIHRCGCRGAPLAANWAVGQSGPGGRNEIVKRRPALTLLAVMALTAATACSSSSGGQRQSPPTPTPSASTRPSAADLQLARLLVRVTDLPKGYTKDATTL